MFTDDSRNAVDIESWPLCSKCTQSSARTSRNKSGTHATCCAQGAGIGPKSEWPTTPPSLASKFISWVLIPAPVPVHPAVVQTKLDLADKFLMNVGEHTHVEWLAAAGLIQAGEARTSCDALQSPRRERMLSPNMPQNGTSNAGSVCVCPCCWVKRMRRRQAGRSLPQPELNCQRLGRH